MSLGSRFKFAAQKASFGQSLRPALQPWINHMKDGDNGQYMDLQETWRNTMALYLSPYCLVGQLAEATGRFVYHSIRGPQ